MTLSSTATFHSAQLRKYKRKLVNTNMFSWQKIYIGFYSQRSRSVTLLRLLILNYLRGILCKIRVRVGHGTSPIWLKFCM